MNTKARRWIRTFIFTITGIALCWLIFAISMETPVVDRDRLRQSLDTGLVTDCENLVAGKKETLIFLPRPAWPHSIRLLQPERVIVDNHGVLILIWSCADTFSDKFHQTASVHVLLADAPPCFPGNPPGLEHCEKVADKVYIRYSPANLKEGKVSIFTRFSAHFQKRRFKD